METRANYVIVGLFTIVAILAAFGFVYWTAAVGQKGETVLLRVRIPGSASGLGQGSAVLFNGVKVGEVKRVYLDLANPKVAIADTQVDRLTPITKSTKADVGLAGLTGQANIELNGGSSDEVNVLDQAEANDKVAEITANPSAVTNLLKTAQTILTRADNVVSQLEGFVGDARQPLTQTLQNVETFSEALSNNADGIDQFLKSAGKLSTTLSGVSDQLNSTLAAAEGLLNSVDRDKVQGIVANVDNLTKSLSQASANLGTVVDHVDETVKSVNQTVTSIGTFSKDADKTLSKVNGIVSKVDGIVDSVDPADVRTALSNIAQATTTVNKVAGDVSKVTGKVSERTDDINSFIANSRQLAERLNMASTHVEETVESVNQTAKSIGAFSKVAGNTLSKVNGVIDSVDPADVRATLSNFAQASTTVNKAANDVSKITEKVSEHTEDINSFLTNSRQLSERLNKASTRVDGILAKVDKLLSSDNTESVITDARDTLKSFKQVADTLNARLGTITDNLAQFTGPGLKEVRSLVRDSRRSISRIERAVTDLEQNPQRIITGGDGEVRRYNGRRRR